MRTWAALVVLGTGLALAAPASAEPENDGVVVINGGASPRELELLRKRIEVLGVLQPTSTAIAAALENGPAYDLRPIRNAYANFEFDRADELIEAGLGDLFANGAPAQIADGAAELFYWRGLVAANDDREDEALAWFAATFRIAPAFEVDDATASPKVRGLINSAKKARPALRPLYIDGAEPGAEDAELAIDGGPVQAVVEEVPLAIGLHLIVITARKKKPFATMVDIRSNRDNGLTVQLDDEDDVSWARRLRLETLDARTTDDRLKRTRRLAKLTGARRFVVIEDEPDPKVRVYDAVAETESAALSLRKASQPSVLAALLGVDSGGLHDGPAVWYKRWYVWAAVGAVVAGGGIGIYAYSQREPSRIMGF
ncbi:MAG: hypothetical protein IPL61_03155 [Myxococcales bacterium]|nr:hypothetical protein [Myxococcales bacterium]